MSWKLREKTKDEIESQVSESQFYAHMVKGRGMLSSEICPLEVTKSNGEVKDVWELSENEVFGLIKQMSKEMESGKSDQQKLTWAFKIVKCWQDRNSQVSPSIAAEFVKLKMSSNKSSALIADLSTAISGQAIGEAKIIANYLNGMSGKDEKVTDEQILKVLDDMANIQAKSQTK